VAKRVKRATAEGKAGRSVVEGRGSGRRAKRDSLEMKMAASGPEVKYVKVLGNPLKQEAEMALAEAAKTLSREAVVQGQSKERDAVAPGLPTPIASFNI
jgi:hypothetical protein